MSERKPQFKPIERALIDKAAMLRKPVELIEEMKVDGFREYDIRGSLWSLIARGQIDLDVSRMIQASSNHPHQLYLLPKD